MYTRRMYRKTPPGYSGVLFSEAITPTSTPEEDKGLSPEQKKLHTAGQSGIFHEGQAVLGHTLSPTVAREESFSSEKTAPCD